MGMSNGAAGSPWENAGLPQVAVTAVTTVCLVLLALLVGYVAVRLIWNTKKDRLLFLKSFKKGKCAVVYFIVLPLLCIAYLFSGEEFGGAVLNSIASGIDLIVLKFDYAELSPLMHADVYYRVVIDLAYVIIVFNTVLFTFTLFGQMLINRLRVACARRTGKDVIVLIGYNDEQAQVLGSLGKTFSRAVVIASLSPSEKDEVFLGGWGAMRAANAEDMDKLFRSLCKRKHAVRVVVNTGADETNLLVLKKIAAFFAEERATDADGNAADVKVCVFGSPSGASAYRHFEEMTKGKIRYLNKYRLIATDFIDRYPITRFMTENEIDYDRGVVKADVDVRTVFVGFGNTNLKLFLTSVENNQLPSEVGGKYCEKPIAYYIYDKKDSDGEKNLNHNYHRYANMADDLQKNKADYFELPPYPAVTLPIEEHFKKMDINDRGFYPSLRKDLMPSEGRRAYNYVVIAFGNDMENLDLAQKFTEKLREWGLEGCTKMFVKIRNGAFARKIAQEEFAADRAFYVFGAEDETVWNTKRMFREEAERMAMRRHVCYSGEAGKPNMTEEEVYAEAVKKWYGGWVQVQRESNAYACLSLRMKLNLLGYDYVPLTEAGEDRSAAFTEKYTAGDVPIRSASNPARVDYGNCEFRTDTVRAFFAMQEHQRWNAYMICNGYIPATVEEAMTGDKQDLLRRRRHGNLTTFAGLVEYKKEKARRAGVSPDDPEATKDYDVIKYDYQLMDYAVGLLGSCGYKIVDKSVVDGRYTRRLEKA